MNQNLQKMRRLGLREFRQSLVGLSVITSFLIILFAGDVMGQTSSREKSRSDVKFSPPESPEFSRHVLPILSKLGCNSGACHGALAGKGGFRLSLNGYNPKGDHFTITQQALGRRVEISDPGRSLILTKPTGALPHKGGLRLKTDSVEYQILSNWIAEGAVGPDTTDAQLTKLEVKPAKIVLSPGESAQVSVFAHYSDGKKENVSRWAKFNSSNTPVVDIDQSGTLSVSSPGEASIVVWLAKMEK